MYVAVDVAGNVRDVRWMFDVRWPVLQVKAR